MKLLESLKTRNKTERAIDDLKSEIEGYESRQRETDRLIAETVELMAMTGYHRRIRPCDMDDPDETECPAGNKLK